MKICFHKGEIVTKRKHAERLRSTLECVNVIMCVCADKPSSLGQSLITLPNLVLGPSVHFLIKPVLAKNFAVSV